MFWRKKSVEEKGKRKKKGPESFPGTVVWQYMVKRYGLTGSVLLGLRRVESDDVIGDKPVTMVRIFNPSTAKEKGVAIDDYDSLDNHPELILYEGHYCEKTRGRTTDINIEKK